MKSKIQKLDAGKFTAESKIDVNKTKVAGGAGSKRDTGHLLDIILEDIL